MAASRLKQDETTVRRTKLLALRRQGIRYDDDRIMELGYASPDAARRDLSRALEANRQAEAAEVATYRQMENERLDDELRRLEVLEAAVHAVLKNRHIVVNNGRVILHPDTDQPMEDDIPILQAIDRLVKIEDARRRNGERRAKLNGLDMPVQTELSGPGGGPVTVRGTTLNELRDLIRTAGDPDVEDDNLDNDDADDGDVDDHGDNT